MKPKPLSSLNYFTVPVAMCSLPGDCVLRNAGGAERNNYERGHYFCRASPLDLERKCSCADCTLSEGIIRGVSRAPSYPRIPGLWGKPPRSCAATRMQVLS